MLLWPITIWPQCNALGVPPPICAGYAGKERGDSVCLGGRDRKACIGLQFLKFAILCDFMQFLLKLCGPICIPSFPLQGARAYTVEHDTMLHS